MMTYPAPDFISSLGEPFMAHRFRRLSEAFVDDIQASLQTLGLRAPARALSTLMLLDDAPGQSVTRIADCVKLSHPLVIHLLSQLESLDLVRFAHDDSDRRKRLVFLTQAGEAEVARLRAAQPVITEAYHGLSREVGVDLITLVDRLDMALGRQTFEQRLYAVAPPKT